VLSKKVLRPLMLVALSPAYNSFLVYDLTLDARAEESGRWLWAKRIDRENPGERHLQGSLAVVNE